ncbi:hypothetical protein LINGRAHAP2_LOCUS22716 [Linum grandiflorum]
MAFSIKFKFSYKQKKIYLVLPPPQPLSLYHQTLIFFVKSVNDPQSPTPPPATPVVTPPSRRHLPLLLPNHRLILRLQDNPQIITLRLPHRQLMPRHEAPNHAPPLRSSSRPPNPQI